MYVSSVSWTTNNRKGRSNSNTRRFPMVYYVDEDGHFGTKRISRLEIPFYKAKICKSKTFYCEKCQKKFKILIKKNESEEFQCPNCLES